MIQYVWYLSRNFYHMFVYPCKMIKLFLWIFRSFYGIFRIFKNQFSVPETWLPASGGRPARSTGPRVGRPTCTTLCTFGQATGPVDRAVDQTESFALCKSAVDRAVDRDAPTVIFMTVGGRPGGRPPAVLADRNIQTASFWERLFMPHLFGVFEKTFDKKIFRVSLVFKTSFQKCFWALNFQFGFVF